MTCFEREVDVRIAVVVFHILIRYLCSGNPSLSFLLGSKMKLFRDLYIHRHATEGKAEEW